MPVVVDGQTIGELPAEICGPHIVKPFGNQGLCALQSNFPNMDYVHLNCTDAHKIHLEYGVELVIQADALELY